MRHEFHRQFEIKRASTCTKTCSVAHPESVGRHEPGWKVEMSGCSPLWSPTAPTPGKPTQGILGSSGFPARADALLGLAASRGGPGCGEARAGGGKRVLIHQVHHKASQQLWFGFIGAVSTSNTAPAQLATHLP